MDDIRRPEPRRRDYALPSHHRSAASQPQDPQHHQAPQHQPAHHQPHLHQHPSPQYQQPSRPVNVTQPAQPAYHQAHHIPPTQHQSPHQPLPSQTVQQAQPAPAIPRTTGRKLGKKVTIAAAVILAAAAIFGAGWMLKSPDSGADGIPQSITRQVNYTLYFPSPMPQGYTYMKDTATFQIGQVYYKFSNGKKRVTVTEQPMPSQKPDLSLLHGYIQFDSPVGQAAVGNNLGESQAVVLTPTTVITMNSIGGVSTDELRTAVSNLKNIGQNPQSKANNG